MTQKHTTILITDSGLGGLSVFAGVAAGLAQDARYDRINLIYFNAWPQQYKGYNHYPDREARAKVFNNAMAAMGEMTPDHIYIACNTLSVIYPFTQFAQKTRIPVTGIVDHGVDMVYNSLTQDPEASVVIFATPTTIQENSHKQSLIERGIDPGRIITQGCLNLAGKIERQPFGDEVKEMIDENAKAAADQLSRTTGNVYAALCCTHFGYCRDQFQQALEKHSKKSVRILNPNDAMTTQACDGVQPGGSPEITMDIVSRVTWETSRIDAYERLLTNVSQNTVNALKHYMLDKDLFSIDID